MTKQKIYIANDHTAMTMKEAVIRDLKSKGYEVIDLSPADEKPSRSYSEEGIKLGQAVVKDKGSFGVALCGTGIGISIAANKVDGVRAGLVYEMETAMLARQHNNANIIATGARMVAIDKAVLLVDIFLKTEFEGGRHEARVATIDEYANK